MGCLVVKLVIAVAFLISVGGAQALGGACSELTYVHIPDAGLREAINRDIIRELGPMTAGDQGPSNDGESVRCEHLARLTRLNAGSPGPAVRSLEGLEYATSLEALNFWVIPLPLPGSYSPHLVESLEPLRNLPNLRSVHIEGRGELDLEPLTSLPMLDELALVGFRITHLEALMRLEELDVVVLSDAGIEDIALLAGWDKPPRYLGLQGNRIRSVSPLMMNPNFGRGHEIDVSYNCLAQSTRPVYDPLWSNFSIDELRDRGVEVVAWPQSACNSNTGQ